MFSIQYSPLSANPYYSNNTVTKTPCFGHNLSNKFPKLGEILHKKVSLNSLKTTFQKCIDELPIGERIREIAEIKNLKIQIKTELKKGEVSGKPAHNISFNLLDPRGNIVYKSSSAETYISRKTEGKKREDFVINFLESVKNALENRGITGKTVIRGRDSLKTREVPKPETNSAEQTEKVLKGWERDFYVRKAALNAELQKKQVIRKTSEPVKFEPTIRKPRTKK